MEEFLNEAVKQVPALTVLCVFVFLQNRAARQERSEFLKFLADERTHRDAMVIRQETAMEGLGEACHQCQRDTTGRVVVALDNNTSMLGKCSSVLDRSERTLSRLDEDLRRYPRLEPGT